MHRRLVTTLALAGPALAVAGVLTVAPASAAPTTTFSTLMSGGAEVPGPGDPDGAGTAELTVDGATGEICYVLTAERTGPLRAGHIHEGSATEAGPIVQGLVAPGQGKRTGPSEGCVVNDEVAQGILADPSDYYVNFHSRKFPAGSVRGQLG